MKPITLFYSMLVILLMSNLHCYGQRSDFERIQQRMYTRFLSKNPAPQNVLKQMESLSPEGAFFGIDYPLLSNQFSIL